MRARQLGLLLAADTCTEEERQHDQYDADQDGCPHGADGGSSDVSTLLMAHVGRDQRRQDH